LAAIRKQYHFREYRAMQRSAAANAGLLLNAARLIGTQHFLDAPSDELHAVDDGQFEWTYSRSTNTSRCPPSRRDVIFFLKGIPIMAALALQPHRKRASYTGKLAI